MKRKIIEPFKLFKILSGRRKDFSLSNPIHIRDKKQKIIDKLSILLRGNFFIPDARALWIRPSVRYLSKYIKDNKVDAILSDGPPHTNTVIAYKLSKKFNIPWLADFQDPWTQVDYYKEFMLTKMADSKHKRMEQKAFKIAKKITIASPTWKKDLESIGAENVDVIFWGYDEDDFKDIRKSNNNSEFIISHAGLLGHDRNAETLFKVLNDLKLEIKKFAGDLKIKLAGSVDYIVKESIKENNLDINTEYLGNIPRDEALQLTINSNILLLPLNKADNAEGRIPGKLFEQMRSNVPILCLGPRESDVKEILHKTKTGQSFEYNDYDRMKIYIVSLYNSYIKKTNTIRLNNISEYSVENQVSKLALYLNEISI